MATINAAVKVPVKQLATAVIQRAERLGLKWHLRPATVTNPTLAGAPQIIYDGDTVAIRAVSLIGPVVEGDRVMALISPPAGNHIVGWVGDGGPQGTIAYVERSTSSTASASPQGVLRLDAVPLKAGRRYRFRTSHLLITSTVANDVGTARLAMTTDGTTAVTGTGPSAVYNCGPVPATGNGVGAILSKDYIPSVDLNLSLLLYHQRLSGTGNISCLGNAGQTTQLMVDDMGPSRTTRGTATVI